VPNLKNNCKNSMHTENKKATCVHFNIIFLMFRCLINFSFAVHISNTVNGSIRIIFSKHSVVKIFSPFVSTFQIHQPPITFDTGLAHMLLFRRVRNKINTVKNVKKNNFLKTTSNLNFSIHALHDSFHPFPALLESYEKR